MEIDEDTNENDKNGNWLKHAHKMSRSRITVSDCKWEEEEEEEAKRLSARKVKKRVCGAIGRYNGWTADGWLDGEASRARQIKTERDNNCQHTKLD